MPTDTIALCLANASNEYQQTVSADALAAAARAGIRLGVHFADDRVTQQIKHVHDCLRQDPPNRAKAIIIMPVRVNSLDRIARDVVLAGIGWICLHRRMDNVADLRREFPLVPICFVSPDQREIGRIQGRQLRAMLPKGGHILYVQGEATSSSAQERLAGMREAIQGASLEVASVLDGNWTPDDAERVVSNFLRIVLSGRSRIDLICCQNDAMAVGAIRALKSIAQYLRRPELAVIPVTGCDGVPSIGQELVRTGQLAATIIIPSTGGPAVDLVARALSRGEQPPAELLLPSESFPSEQTLAKRPPRRQ